MNKQLAASLLVTLSAFAAGCGDIGAGIMATPTRPIDLYVSERQTVYVLKPGQQRIDAYQLRGGIAWLGSVPLPVNAHYEYLSEQSGQLLLEGPEHAAVVDPRALRLVDAWHVNPAHLANSRPEDAPRTQSGKL